MQYYITILITGIMHSMLTINISIYLHQKIASEPLLLSISITSYFVASFVASIGISTASDYLGHRMKLFALVSLVSTLGFIGCAVTDAPLFVFIFLALFIAPASSLTSLFFAYISENTKDSSRILTLRGIYSAAWVIGPTLGAWAVNLGDFRLLFLGLSTLGFMAFSMALLYPSESKEFLTDKNHNRHAKKITAMGIYGLLLMIVLHGAMSISTTILPIIIREELLLPTPLIGFSFSICAGCEVVLLMIASKYLYRYSAITFLVGGCICGIIYYIILSQATTPWVFLAAQLFNGAFIAAMVGVGMTWYQSIMTDRPGLATGLFVNAYTIGSIVMTPAVGLVASASHNFQAAALLACIAITMGMVGLMAFPNQQCESVPNV